MNRFSESITLSAVEAFETISLVESVASAIEAGGYVAEALVLEDAIAVLRERLIGGSGLPWGQG